MQIIGIGKSFKPAIFIFMLSLWLLSGCDGGGGKDKDDASLTAVSGTADVPAFQSGGVTVAGYYFQYRKYTYGETNRCEYRGLVSLGKGNAPIQESDIKRIVMKNDRGREIALKGIGYYHKRFIQGTWNSDTLKASFSDKIDSGFMIDYHPDAKIDEGAYTYQITTAADDVLNIRFYFPGRLELPAPQLATMRHEKRPNGDVLFSWNNPEGCYDEIKLTLHATTARQGERYDIFEIMLPKDKNEFILPKEVTEKLTGLHSPLRFFWQIKTHANTSAGMNYARGWSDSASLCWLDCTPPHLLKQACLPPDGSHYNANISHKIELKFSEKMNGGYSYHYNSAHAENQWNKDNTTLTITFAEDLMDGQEYVFRLNPGNQPNGFSDVAGNRLEHDTRFSFTQDPDATPGL